MPTYDYRCRACGHEFEAFQSIRDGTLRTCPKCKKQKLERLIGSGAGILFKGGGFYQTDYRSEGYKQAESAEKGDSKPAATETPAKSGTESSGKDSGAKGGESSTKQPPPAKESKTAKRPKKSAE